MIVTCESCKSRYKLDDSKITGRGAKITCPKCKTVFVVFAPRAAGGQEESPASSEWDADEPTRVGTMSPSGAVVTSKGTFDPPVPAVHEVTRPAPPDRAATAPGKGASGKGERVELPLSKDEVGARAAALDFRKVGVAAWKVKVKIGLIYDFSDTRTLRKYINDGRVTHHDVISWDGKSWRPIGEIPDLDLFFVQTYERLESEYKAKGEPANDGPAVADLGNLAAELAAKAAAEEEGSEARTGGGGTNPGFNDPFDQLKKRQRERAGERKAARKKDGGVPANARWGIAAAVALAVGVGAWASLGGGDTPKPAAAQAASARGQPRPGGKVTEARAAAKPLQESDEIRNLRNDIMKGATALPEPEAAPDPAPVAPYDKEQLTPVGPRPGTTTVITSAPSTTARVVVTPPPATTTTAADSGDWLEAGQAEAARGNWAGAAKAYAKASAQAPEDRKILARLGEAQLNSGDAAGAESSLSRAGSGGVECLLGDARKALGDDAGANAAWTNCLKADPSKAGTYQAKLDGGG